MEELGYPGSARLSLYGRKQDKGGGSLDWRAATGLRRVSPESEMEDRKEDKGHLLVSPPRVVFVGPWQREVLWAGGSTR